MNPAQQSAFERALAAFPFESAQDHMVTNNYDHVPNVEALAAHVRRLAVGLRADSSSHRGGFHVYVTDVAVGIEFGETDSLGQVVGVICFCEEPI